jgi:hypothetical protein
MKKILVIAIVCLLGSFAAAAQTVKVNGTIVDEQNRPVEFVNVALIWHYKIFCVNAKYGIQYGFRIFYLIALQNEENYEREESCSA